MARDRKIPEAMEAGTNGWPLAAGGLFVVAVLGAVFAYNLLNKYRCETAILQGQLYEAQNAKQPQPIQVSASENYFKALVASAKARPGTREALALLEKDQFDALQANLLVARAIVPGIDTKAVGRWFDELAGQVRQHEAQMRQTPDGQQYLAEKGEPEFKMAAANEVISGIRKIGYVDRDAVNPSDPRHLFVHGIVDTNKGTCVTMALMWKVLADKLGWPMHLRCAPNHLYLAWDDGQYLTNLEATASASPVKDEDYRKRERVSQEDYDKGRYMRNLSPRQILAGFVSSRAYHWHGKGDYQKEFEDLLLAVELDPVTPSYRKNLVIEWQKLKVVIEKDFEGVVGPNTIAEYRLEQQKKRARDRAIADAEAQTDRLKQGSGIPDVKQVTSSPMFTGQGYEYNPSLKGR